MALLRSDRIDILAVRVDAPEYLEVEGYHCPLCGVRRGSKDLRVATVQVHDRGLPFEVLLCLDCVSTQQFSATAGDLKVVGS